MGLYSDNAQRTSKRGKNISHATHPVRYQSKDARQNEIYLLSVGSAGMGSVVTHRSSEVIMNLVIKEK